MRWLWRRRATESDAETRRLRRDAARGAAVLEATAQALVVLDGAGRVVAASRGARELGVSPREVLPPGLADAAISLAAYEAGGVQERLLLLEEEESDAYEELRVAFTASVSHELRTPLARLLALLESAELPGAELPSLVHQARDEVEEMRELVDDLLFLSELETGTAVVALSPTPALEVVEAVVDRVRERAERAGVSLTFSGSRGVRLPLRPRMLGVVVENLAANAIRYAGPGSTCAIAVAPALLRVTDDGRGVAEDDLPRLFERFYRSDRARASRGTGLGLAIVKHIVTAAGGSVHARAGRDGGLEVECRFPET